MVEGIREAARRQIDGVAELGGAAEQRCRAEGARASEGARERDQDGA